jgi:hypothetical protein
MWSVGVKNPSEHLLLQVEPSESEECHKTCSFVQLELLQIGLDVSKREERLEP